MRFFRSLAILLILHFMAVQSSAGDILTGLKSNFYLVQVGTKPVKYGDPTVDSVTDASINAGLATSAKITQVNLGDDRDSVTSQTLLKMKNYGLGKSTTSHGENYIVAGQIKADEIQLKTKTHLIAASNMKGDVDGWFMGARHTNWYEDWESIWEYDKANSRWDGVWLQWGNVALSWTDPKNFSHNWPMEYTDDYLLLDEFECRTWGHLVTSDGKMNAALTDFEEDLIYCHAYQEVIDINYDPLEDFVLAWRHEWITQNVIFGDIRHA